MCKWSLYPIFLDLSLLYGAALHALVLGFHYVNPHTSERSLDWVGASVVHAQLESICGSVTCRWRDALHYLGSSEDWFLDVWVPYRRISKLGLWPGGYEIMISSLFASFFLMINFTRAVGLLGSPCFAVYVPRSRPHERRSPWQLRCGRASLGAKSKMN